MGKYDKGVPWYTKGVAHIPIHFPTDDIKCGYCPFCYADSLGRPKCRLTGSLIYSTAIISDDCPIEFEVNEEGVMNDGFDGEV